MSISCGFRDDRIVRTARHSARRLFAAGISVTAQSGQAATPPPAPASPLKPIAGVQDVMASMIDPAADFLWESVSTTVTRGKTVEKQPHTDEEWAEVRRQAIILTEGANLIMMDGRHVVKEGSKLEDHGTPGNLTAEESEKAIAENRAAFVAFSTALRDVGVQMLAAADSRNPQGLVDAGDTLDQVCEGCHLQVLVSGPADPAVPGSGAGSGRSRLRSSVRARRSAVAPAALRRKRSAARLQSIRRSPPAPLSVSKAPPPSAAAMPPVRPAPSEKPTPEVRHSVGNTCAASAYKPTCTALIAMPATAMPLISVGSPSAALPWLSEVAANHASAASVAAPANAATASGRRDPTRVSSHEIAITPPIPARLNTNTPRTAVASSKPSDVSTSGAQLKKAYTAYMFVRNASDMTAVSQRSCGENNALTPDRVGRGSSPSTNTSLAE